MNYCRIHDHDLELPPDTVELGTAKHRGGFRLVRFLDGSIHDVREIKPGRERANHTRYHAKRGYLKLGCEFCYPPQPELEPAEPIPETRKPEPVAPKPQPPPSEELLRQMEPETKNWTGDEEPQTTTMKSAFAVAFKNLITKFEEKQNAK